MAALFCDRGESAKTADRPEFQRMVAYCSAHKVDAAVVWKLDRFARNTYDHAVFQAILAKAGVEVRSVTEPLSDSPAGKLLQTMLAGIAQFDNDVRAERSRAGMASVAQAGGWTTLPPLGYRLARVNRLSVLEPHPEDGAPVKAMFQQVAAGSLAVRDAHTWLSGRLGRRIYPQAIHTMLRNAIYAGIIQNRLTNHVPVKAAFPGLVDQATWDRVQVVLKDGAQVRSLKMTDRFPVRGFLRCSCGASYTASASRNRVGRYYQYYHCRCGVRIQGATVESSFMVFLQRANTAVLPWLQIMREEVEAEYDQMRAQAIVDAEAMRKKLVSIERKAEKLLELYLIGGLTAEAYKTKGAELDAEAGVVKTQIHDSDIDEENANAALSMADHLFRDLPVLFDRTPAKHRRRLVVALFGGLLTMNERGEISNTNKGGIVNMLHGPQREVSALAPPSGIVLNTIGELKRLLDGISDLIQAA